MHVLSKLERAPREVLEEITLRVVSLSPLGPPVDILALLPLSKTVWRRLSIAQNPHIYAHIFRMKFDVRAVVRRLGDECEHATELSQELIRRCDGLKRIRNGRYSNPINTLGQEDGFLRDDLWMAYLMFIESDGNNVPQLVQYARVDRLVSTFIAPGGIFHNEVEANGGWIVDNEVNSLTAWLFWFTDKERANSETALERQKVLQAFAHVFVGSYKYPSSHVPITSFEIRSVTLPRVLPLFSPFPLAASPISPPCFIQQHFGCKITLAHPLLTPAAIMICVVRLEAAGADINHPLPFDTPTTRAEAIETGWYGPTREDYDEQQKPTTKFVEWAHGGSSRHEHDWTRLRTCYNPWSDAMLQPGVYTLGELEGVWVGRWFEISRTDFQAILAPDESAQPHPPLVYSFPMKFRLREYHQHEANDVVEHDDMSGDGRGKGVFNAWLPAGTTLVETGRELRVSAPNQTGSTYQTYDSSAAAQATLDAEMPPLREHEGPYGRGVWDVILTAETDETFGRAWGHARYYGRVRGWDGLVMLVCAESLGDERRIFRGYLHGMQNLVGRWRETGTPVEVPGWEGVWSMTKEA